MEDHREVRGEDHPDLVTKLLHRSGNAPCFSLDKGSCGKHGVTARGEGPTTTATPNGGERMSQQYPQSSAPVQGGAPGFQPPKQKKPFVKRTWVLVTASVFTILVVIGILSGGSDTAPTSGSTKSAAPRAAAKPTLPTGKVSTVIPSPKASAPAPTQAVTECTGNRNDPCTVSLGVAFTVGKHRLDKGWRLKEEEYLGTKLTGTVTNVGDATSTAFFTVKFLQGSRVVANFQCSSNELEPGQEEAVECFNTSDSSKPVKKGTYDKITAEADF